MSVGQHRMWFVQSVDPDSALLNICVSYRLSGTVDIARLHRAVDAVAARHPVLHTTYDTDGEGDPQPVVREDLRPRMGRARPGRVDRPGTAAAAGCAGAAGLSPAIRPEQGFTAAGHGGAPG